MPQMQSSGAINLSGGSFSGPKPRLDSKSTSLWSDRYAAKNKTSNILPNSEGCTWTGPKTSQFLLPPISVPKIKDKHSTISVKMPSIYWYCINSRSLPDKRMTASKTHRPIISHLSCGIHSTIFSRPSMTTPILAKNITIGKSHLSCVKLLLSKKSCTAKEAAIAPSAQPSTAYSCRG